MAKEFWWREFDVRNMLPANWKEQLVELALSRARSHVIRPTSVTSREGDERLALPVLTVGGSIIQEAASWLCELYLNSFREIGQTLLSEPVLVASSWRYAINLNLQKGLEMRYECHVDSNPLEALLYVTDHPEGSGGELVVARRREAKGVDAVRADSIVIRPRSGRLVFFDAREHAHFVEPLKDPNGYRVVAAMNYYTSSCPESSRPPDLDRHLGLVAD